jgi:hypothetical protein
MDPLIHKTENGTSEGFVNVLQKIIELNADKYLSGHAEPATKADIETLRNSIMEKGEKVGEMIKAVKPLMSNTRHLISLQVRVVGLRLLRLFLW